MVIQRPARVLKVRESRCRGADLLRLVQQAGEMARGKIPSISQEYREDR